MPTVRVSASLLRRLCDINQFAIPTDVEYIFFGIRGATPFNTENFNFEDSRTIRLTDIDYLAFRCTIGQWRLKDDFVSIVPASTVPGIKNINKARANKGSGTNQMIPGFYTDFEKGIHAGSATFAHRAFRQMDSSPRPVRRTITDAVYDDNDLITYEVQHDNLHSGFRKSVDDNINGSNGCQIVVGLPECDVYRESGAWKSFRTTAYAAKQTYFPYFLLASRDYARVMEDPSVSIPRKLRYGSSGDLVELLQEKLVEKNVVDSLEATGKLDIPTFKAIVKFQIAQKQVGDGVVGKSTADLLGLDLGVSAGKKA
jgi:hypothetical protein